MKLFKKANKELKEKEAFTSWWGPMIRLFEKDTGRKIEPKDLEKEAQKIYKHWLNSYL